ncbi:MAG: DUF2849 domain-containing protein [Alphaproteobacteria bacterium]|nr:DUF2849 domain-containing protein [Alphaproteobacteria bacterium]
MTQQAVTANLLGDGRVAFLTWDGDWSDNVADSHIATSDEESEWLLETAQRAVAAQVAVDPYLIEIDASSGSAWPVQRREQIRAAGPTGTINTLSDASVDGLKRVA